MIYILFTFDSKELVLFALINKPRHGLRELFVVVFSHKVMLDSLQPVDCNPPGSTVHGISQASIKG